MNLNPPHRKIPTAQAEAMLSNDPEYAQIAARVAGIQQRVNHAEAAQVISYCVIMLTFVMSIAIPPQWMVGGFLLMFLVICVAVGASLRAHKARIAWWIAANDSHVYFYARLLHAKGSIR